MIVTMLAVLTFAQQPADTASHRPPASAGRPCIMIIDSLPRVRQVVTAIDTNVYVGGGVLSHCKDSGTTFRSDSGAYYGGLGRWDMVGRAHIADTSLTLDANLIVYYLKQERLDAHNNVVAVNRENHSVLRGPNLTYYRAVQGIRDTAETYATQRPAIEYHGTAADTGEPYVIVADRVRFKGNDRMWGGGQVTIDRSDLAARGDSLSLNQTTGLGLLLGHPRVTGKGAESYTLVGTRIELGFTNHEITLMKALGQGKASGTAWTLTADTIHLHLADRKLEQALAWGDSSRAHAVSSTNTITADSLALDTPGQILTEVRSYRRALSTSKRDSTAADSSNDWISGDTLVAHWIQAPDSTGKVKPVLKSIISRGSAHAFTHTYNTNPDSAAVPPSLDYTLADEITILLKQAKVETVVAAGHVSGAHFDPVKEKSDSTKADSTKKAPAGP
jgi:hypothetical protein